MNPYASFLGDREPREVIGETPGRLTEFARTLGTGGLERIPAPGKWSAHAIICHLADCEVVFAFRFRQAMAEAHHVCQPFDQDLWAQPYDKLPTDAALAVFSTVRRWNQALLDSATPEQMAKKFTHPERGEMTVRTVLETMAGHDVNHLRQLEAIAAQAAGASVGAAR